MWIWRSAHRNQCVSVRRVIWKYLVYCLLLNVRRQSMEIAHCLFMIKGIEIANQMLNSFGNLLSVYFQCRCFINLGITGINVMNWGIVANRILSTYHTIDRGRRWRDFFHGFQICLCGELNIFFLNWLAFIWGTIWSDHLPDSPLSRGEYLCGVWQNHQRNLG